MRCEIVKQSVFIDVRLATEKKIVVSQLSFANEMNLYLTELEMLFLDIGSSRRFHWDDWALVSMP